MKNLCFIVLFGLTGCTTIMNSDKSVIISQKGFGLHITASSMSANAAPDILLGTYSIRVAIVPSATNTLYSPKIMDAYTTESSYNPFNVDTRDNMGFGDVYIGGTNDTSKAIVPTPYIPRN